LSHQYTVFFISLKIGALVSCLNPANDRDGKENKDEIGQENDQRPL